MQLLRSAGYRYLSPLLVNPAKNKESQVFVLCYHSIDTDGWRFSVSPDNFKKQINYLLRCYRPLSLPELATYLRGEIKFNGSHFLITFDDGYRNILSIYDFCQRVGVRPSVFVLSQPAKADRRQLQSQNPLLESNELVFLKKSGWVIGCHSATHPDFRSLSAKEKAKEISGSKRELEEQLHAPVDYFAYPKGVYNEEIKEEVRRAGYRLAFSMDNYELKKDSNPLTLPRTGVDGTHTFEEFKNVFLPGSIRFRRLVKLFYGNQ